MDRVLFAAGSAALALLSASPLAALDPRLSLSQYVHSAWHNKEGLSQSTIEAILQTRDGYLWLGTEEGLVRFDGVRFRVFDKRNTEAITINHVRTLFEGRDGSLWIGTEGGGLVRHRDGVFQRYGMGEGGSHNAVRFIDEDPEGNLWIATRGGLKRWREGRLTTYGSKDGLPTDVVTSLHLDGRGALWVGTSEGLSRLENGTFITYTTKDALPDNLIRALEGDQEGALWIATEAGLTRHAGGTFTTFTTKEGLAGNRIRSLYRDREGVLWIGTLEGGLSRLHDGRFTTYSTAEGLSSDEVRAIHEDREGGLWIGTAAGGLNHLKDPRFASYAATEGIAHDDVKTLYEDRHGTLWIGTERGLTRFRRGLFIQEPGRGLRSQRVLSIAEDGQGRLWVGTGGGIGRLEGDRWISYSAKDGLANDYVFSLHPERGGGLWIGTRGGVSLFKDGHWRTYAKNDGLQDEAVRAVLEDREGTVWLGTGSGGLSRLRDGRVTTYTTRDGLSNDLIVALYEDQGGTLWIGTQGGGLNRFRDGRFMAYTTREGLFDDVVFQILEDGLGNLWMSCNKGIFRVVKQELEDLAAGRRRTVTSVSYDEDDGMRSRECNGGTQPAGWKTKDGRLWFPTIEGVVAVDPTDLRMNTLPPPVLVEEVIVDRQALPPGRMAVLSPGKRDFEFHYVGLSLRSPGKVRFRYRLEGFDEDWIDAGSRRVAYYTNLSPGSYRFTVKASNNDGVWNDAGASFELSLQPYLHQTYGFYILSAVALTLLAGSGYLLRVRGLHARERELVLLVEDRTRSLAEAKRQVDDANADLEARVNKGIEALREADRLATYGRMVAGVAHEVRNPIFAMQTAAYALRERLGHGADQAPEIRTIERESRRMTDLMQDLLDLSKPPDLLLAPTDPTRLLEEAVESCGTAAAPGSPGVELLRPSSPLPKVVMDKGRMVQVLCNLLENSRKHGRGATAIRLSAEPRNGPEAAQVVIKVADDGAGIPPEDIPRLFEPFFTTGQGTGLGLAIVHRIVSDHGGRIAVESAPGAGSVFTIELPVAGPARKGGSSPSQERALA